MRRAGRPAGPDGPGGAPLGPRPAAPRPGSTRPGSTSSISVARDRSRTSCAAQEARRSGSAAARGAPASITRRSPPRPRQAGTCVQRNPLGASGKSIRPGSMCARPGTPRRRHARREPPASRDRSPRTGPSPPGRSSGCRAGRSGRSWQRFPPPLRVRCDRPPPTRRPSAAAAHPPPRPAGGPPRPARGPGRAAPAGRPGSPPAGPPRPDGAFRPATRRVGPRCWPCA